MPFRRSPRPAPPTTPAPRPTRAQQLIEDLLAAHVFDQATLARELVMSAAALNKFRDGKEPMPLDRQLCLALLVIERVPRFARRGHQLRSQAQAAMAFEARATDTHSSPPPNR